MTVVNFPVTETVAADCELPLELEPALEVEPEDAVELEPESGIAVTAAPRPLVEVLPADFQIPLLTKFVPNPALRTAVVEAAAYALSLPVAGAEGLAAADGALGIVRARIKAIDEHFADPTRIANDLHKRLTGIRGEWQAEGKAAIETVGRRIYTEQRRIETEAAEARRKAQAEADRQARDAARAAAEEAAKSAAPAAVVEQMVRQAETMTAPPVSTPAPSALKTSTVVTTWKARLKGTTGADEFNPSIDAVTPAQRHQVMELLKAIIDGRAPIAAIDINWSFLNARAKSDKSELSIPGVEAFEQGSVRAKASRTSR